jgi:uncharacterized RDD family membrane protein YckC
MRRIMKRWLPFWALISGVVCVVAQAPELEQAREAADLILRATDSPAVTRAKRRQVGNITRIFSDLKSEADTDYRDVLLMFGDGVVEGDVEGRLTVFWGNAELRGRVTGPCTVIFGTLTLGPDAELAGETRLIGGGLRLEAGAVVRNQPFELGGNYEQWPLIAGAVDWVRWGVILGRPIAPGVPLSWFIMGVFFLGYAVAAVLFPRPVQICAYSIRTRPASSFLLGVLLPILVLAVSVLLIMTGIGVLALPLVAVALVFAVVLGKAAVLQYVGQRLGEAMRFRALRQPGTALCVGGTLLCLIYTVPVVGLAVWALTLLFAMGAATLAVIESLRAEGTVFDDDPEAGVEFSESLAMIHVGPAEGVAAKYPPAGFWSRMCAILLDWFLVGTLAAVTSAGILFLPMIFAYYIGGWVWKGTTLGGHVMNQRVVRDRGRPINGPSAVVRSLASVFSLAVFGLGFVWSGLSRDKKSWHDAIAGTNVVRVPENEGDHGDQGRRS